MNKLFGLFLLALAFLAPSLAQAANCFWVGGSGTWDGTNTGGGGSGGIKWASASGGSSACAGSGTGGSPGAADNANFDANSGGGTATIATNITITSLVLTNYTGTLHNSVNNNTVSVASLVGLAGAYTINFGAATWTISGSSPNLFQVHNGATISAASSTIHVVHSGTGANINTANKTWGTVSFSVTTAAGAQVNSQGSGATFGTLILGNTAGNFNFVASAATVTSAFTVMGTPTKQIGVIPANGVTLTLTGATATATWAAFHRITASGAAITATNSFDLGGNTNVGVTPPSGGSCSGRIIGG